MDIVKTYRLVLLILENVPTAPDVRIICILQESSAVYMCASLWLPEIEGGGKSSNNNKFLLLNLFKKQSTQYAFSFFRFK